MFQTAMEQPCWLAPPYAWRAENWLEVGMGAEVEGPAVSMGTAAVEGGGGGGGGGIAEAVVWAGAEEEGARGAEGAVAVGGPGEAVEG